MLNLAKKTEEFANELRYQVDVFVIDAMVNPFRPKEFLALLRQCRKTKDDYSRAFLWLEMIRQGLTSRSTDLGLECLFVKGLFIHRCRHTTGKR